jgi:hypothetical protein
MGTRIQDKSRPAKRPIAEATYAQIADSLTYTAGKPPKNDPRGYPNGVGNRVGVPSPVLVNLTIVA